MTLDEMLSVLRGLADACDDCVYGSVVKTEYPCNECLHNYDSKYMEREEEPKCSSK